MSKFIKTTADLKKYSSTGFNFDFSLIQPYVNQAERDYAAPVLSEGLYDTWGTTPPTTGNPAKVFELLSEATANLSIFFYIPMGAVIVSNNGILVSSSEHSKPAEWHQVRDLQRSLVKIGYSAIDKALKIMEANEGDFPLWAASSSYTVFKELYVPTADDFNKYFNINSCRRTFLALTPYIREAQRTAFTWLDNTTAQEISAAASDKAKQVREDIRAALVNMAVAKASRSGMFNLTSSSLQTKSLELPGEKIIPMDAAWLNHFAEGRETVANNFLEMAQQQVLDNPDVFTNYEQPTLKTNSQIINKKGMVFF